VSVHTLPFLGFVVASVVAYYLFPKRFRWWILLAAGVLFYLLNGVRAALYMGFTVVLTYIAGRGIERIGSIKPFGDTPELRKQHKKRLKRWKNGVLAAAIIVNLLSLGVLKYSAFFASAVNGIAGRDFLPIPSFLLPLGISFYIFQTLGYLIDIHRGKVKAEENFFRYTLFVTYFPQLVQGPINRYDAMREALYSGNRFEWSNIQRGTLRMMLGILKKAMIADALAPAVAAVYSGYGNYPGVMSFLAAALYCVQLYCDFSGGMDLLCGVSTLFGIPMAENFARPYFATSLADFWRRWHISLGEWMKDYLFYPLAFSPFFTKLTKKARGVLPADLVKRLTPCICTFIVFLAVGVWQGPGFANIAYGLWNGFWMSLGLLTVPFFAKHRDRLPKNKVILTGWGILRTNFLVIIGRYFSNAAGGSIRSALGMLRHTVVAPGFGLMTPTLFAELGLGTGVLLKVGIALCILFVISLLEERGVKLFDGFCRLPTAVQFLLLFAGLALIVFGVYGNGDYTPIAFVYENV